MKVSIIITIYNEEKYIEKCLDSLAHQNYKDFEIIIVDDGSNDNSKLKCSTFAKASAGRQNLKLQLKVKNFKLIKQEHQGLASARNNGAKQAQGEILVFLDADMVFDKNFLLNLIQPIIQGKATGTYSTEELVANWENVWARCWNYNWNMPIGRRIDEKRKDQTKEFRAILASEFWQVNGLDSVGYTDAWTLSKKLGYLPTPTKAKYFHFNPSSLKDVFNQARWVAKRPYKMGIIGKIIAFIRVNPLFSLLIGISKSITKKEPRFLIFKLVYDCGVLIGLLKLR